MSAMGGKLALAMPLLRPMRTLPAVLLIAGVTACRPDYRGLEDASAIYGCYTAPDAPSFTLSSAGMRAEGLSDPVPFRYELKKVGYVVAVPLSADYSGGRFSFSRGDEHYYRMVASDAGPTMLVAFGHEAFLVTYRRLASANCTR
jgi:hypothetical protein